ncbi:MAG: hypothetical protein RLZZ427_1368 [Pseudomonadota bacterium]|jgi:dienelactone hydrolase
MIAKLVTATRAACCAALLLAVPAQAATGTLPVRREVDPSLTHHVLFRPVLPAGSATKLPVVVFAGGGCRNAGARFSELLSEVASHGYFVVALGDIGDPAKDVDPAHEPEYNGRPTKTDVSQIDWAVNWVKDQNTRTGGRFAGRLDVAHIALMGQSCGGVQSIDAASRLPGIATLVVLNSGLFPDDRQMGGSEVKRADLGKIKTPVMILLGGKEDVAYDNGQANFDLMVNAPTFLGSANYGHRATYFEKDGGLYGTVVRDWLDWQLKGKVTAAARFTGQDCGLCTDPQWAIRRRGI